jgi:hypothetical protein
MPKEIHSAVWSRILAIHDAISLSNDEGDLRYRHRRPERWDTWYLRVLTAIDTLAARQPVLYLTSDLRRDGDVVGRVLAFTEKLVIAVDVTNVEALGRNGDVRGRAWARNTLALISVTPVYPVAPLEEATDLRYPAFQQFELRYPEEHVLIPMTVRASEGAYDGAARLYPGLVDDLGE